MSLKQAHKGCIVDLASEVWVQLSGLLHVIQALSDIALQEGRTSALALSDAQYLTKRFLYDGLACRNCYTKCLIQIRRQGRTEAAGICSAVLLPAPEQWCDDECLHRIPATHGTPSEILSCLLWSGTSSSHRSVYIL